MHASTNVAPLPPETPPDDNMDRIRALLSDLRASFPADDCEPLIGLGSDNLCMVCRIDEAAPDSMVCPDCEVRA